MKTTVFFQILADRYLMPKWYLKYFSNELNQPQDFSNDQTEPKFTLCE